MARPLDHSPASFQSVCLALCHAPDYQEEHRESLAQDWAHVPIPKDTKLFNEVTAAGDLVARLLDPASDARATIRGLVPNPDSLAVLTKDRPGKFRLSDLIVTVPHFGGSRGGWSPRPAQVLEEAIEAVGERTGNLRINDGLYFSNVPEPVWLFELGGYPVLKKWLGYRDSKASRREATHPRREGHSPRYRPESQPFIALLPRLNALYQRAILNAWTSKEMGLE